MESDEDDFVFYGTPIEREDDVISRKKKAIAESSGQLRTLPAWKQEVRDEEGRRRFHGAFTGGYSAGYYNTVGSKEGWAPQSFKSSRKNRAEFKEQNILNFLDEDEKSELEGRFLGTTSQFDTFGFTAAEIARKQAETEQKQRPSVIPGPAPDEIVVPANESIGVKLLLKMGWSRGRTIKDSHSDALYDARRQARRAFLAFSSDDPKVKVSESESVEGDIVNFPEEPVNDDAQISKNIPVYVLNPKQDLHGLGFDPYKHAPEFREKKRSRLANKGGLGFSRDSLFGLKSGKAAPGFGIGALEELDAEDEDVYATGYEFEDAVQEVEEPSTLRLENQTKKEPKDHGDLPGFRVASNSDYKMERFEAPLIPKDFVPHHKFSGPLDLNRKSYEVTPPDTPPPEDGNLKLLIEGVANLVAKCGKLYEDLSREKNQSNPLFSFLSGGTGHEYYARKLWEAQQKHNDQTSQQVDGKMTPGVKRLTAESRGQILGEKPLEKSSEGPSSFVASTDIQLQFNLTDTFTKSTSVSELMNVEKPFKDDPAKQERFEQFLKEKYKGGLRSASSSLASEMSEAARAQERLSFEAAAEAIEKGRQGRGSKPLTPSAMDFIPGGVMQFTSGELEPKKDLQADDILRKKTYPKREEFQWRPSPLLCKRFDLIDPYMGKPPPAPRIRSKMDSLIFTSDSVKGIKPDDPVTSIKDISPLQQYTAEDITKSITENETEGDVEVENIERPVDLYKAIFSDDSDDEGGDSGIGRVDNQEKKAEVANTALSRLIAGDFLESLGKELGIEVPPDMPYPKQKSKNIATRKELVNEEDTRIETLDSKNNDEISLNHDLLYDQQIAQEGGLSKSFTIHGNNRENSNVKTKGVSNMNYKPDRSELNINDVRKIKSPLVPNHDYSSSSEEEKSRKRSSREKYEEYRKLKTPVTHRRNYSSSSSLEEEKSRKRSRHHGHKRRDAGSDSFSDDERRDRHSSRSKEKKGSSREKSRSEKHSKHRKHRKHESRNSNEKDNSRSRSEKKRRE
ncbi:G patch domain-containing protein TGH isoform X1 [Vigna radiata var. radiata]|uniref:G patch domain-containing protein TGH isoform X1 n=1 Tax=Vigna radiata var. radiata TaxID=3916 RepID=A0A1S3UTP2_VIGRR|nr:G patch domain-containing protein TGH isoform X1 [Vigna radiata var. radiata]